MLWTIAIILLILWLLGFFAFNVGNLIHILLVIAIIVVLWRIIAARTVSDKPTLHSVVEQKARGFKGDMLYAGSWKRCGPRKFVDGSKFYGSVTRWKTRSHTPCPSFKPRCSNFVNGRCAGRGAKSAVVLVKSGSALNTCRMWSAYSCQSVATCREPPGFNRDASRWTNDG